MLKELDEKRVRPREYQLLYELGLTGSSGALERIMKYRTEVYDWGVAIAVQRASQALKGER